MKKSFFSFLCILTMGISLFAQKFTEVTRTQAGTQVALSNSDVLEVKLTANPSTGYGWYLKNTTRQSIVKQIGDFEFITDSPESPVGADATQITRFVGVYKGTAELVFEYVRPWETDAEPLDSYKITVSSDGAYTGSYQAPAPTQAEEYVPTAVGLALPAAFNLQAQCTPVKNKKVVVAVGHLPLVALLKPLLI